MESRLEWSGCKHGLCNQIRLGVLLMSNNGESLRNILDTVAGVLPLLVLLFLGFGRLGWLSRSKMLLGWLLDRDLAEVS